MRQVASRFSLPLSLPNGLGVSPMSAMAQSGRKRLGRACPLCPGISDIHLLGDRQGIVDLDAEVADRALDLRVTEEQLHGAEVAGAAINQGSLSPPQGVSAEDSRVQSDAFCPAC
jgi:hypothetical protein